MCRKNERQPPCGNCRRFCQEAVKKLPASNFDMGLNQQDHIILKSNETHSGAIHPRKYIKAFNQILV